MIREEESPWKKEKVKGYEKVVGKISGGGVDEGV